MYQTKKNYITPEMRLPDLIMDNPVLLLMLSYFEIESESFDKKVAEICAENNISFNLFMAFGNMYNGFPPPKAEEFSENDIAIIIQFLRNSHFFYKEEKYPEIRFLIKKICTAQQSQEMNLLSTFFEEYFKEVNEHLEYEENVAFPYFTALLNPNNEKKTNEPHSYSINDYREHHTDIETKLSDLKNLLLKHIHLKKDLQGIRRKLLQSLFELEFDLNIHALIEELVLIPLIEKIEK